MTLPDTFTPTEWAEAGEMSLRCVAASGAAGALVDTLLSGLPFNDEKPPRPSTMQRRRVALAAILADLLKLYSRGRIGSFGLKRENLSRAVHGFAADVFKDVRDAMVSGGMLHVKEGRQLLHTAEGFGQGPKITAAGGWVARFKLSSEALENIEGSGVALDDWATHWRRSVAAPREVLNAFALPPLIQIRASNGWKGKGKTKGNVLTAGMDEPGVREMHEDLEAHNDFVKAAGVDGIDFLGLRRSFSEGEKAARRWKSGGRFYSIHVNGVGTRYEAMSADDRLRSVRLAGQSVSEVDMSASQLRLLYAVLDLELPAGLDADPYHLPGHRPEQRQRVKDVIAQALGNNRPRAGGWGRDAKSKYARENNGASLAEAFDFAEYEAEVLKAHPVLERLGTDGVPDTLHLHWIESEVIRRAMASLRSEGIPSLPVHDSLLVPISMTHCAQAALEEAFKAQVSDMIGYPTKQSAKVKVKADTRVLELT